jgi:hypothetical protein
MVNRRIARELARMENFNFFGIGFMVSEKGQALPEELSSL